MQKFAKKMMGPKSKRNRTLMLENERKEKKGKWKRCINVYFRAMDKNSWDQIGKAKYLQNTS